MPLNESSSHRQCKALWMDVSQALDLLRVEGAERRDRRVEWQRRGLIDDRNRVNLEALAAPATRRAPPAAPAKPKPKPMTPEQFAARVRELVAENQAAALAAQQPTEAEERWRRRERAFRRISERCGVHYSGGWYD